MNTNNDSNYNNNRCSNYNNNSIDNDNSVFRTADDKYCYNANYDYINNIHSVNYKKRQMAQSENKKQKKSIRKNGACSFTIAYDNLRSRSAGRLAGRPHLQSVCL